MKQGQDKKVMEVKEKKSLTDGVGNTIVIPIRNAVIRRVPVQEAYRELPAAERESGIAGKQNLEQQISGNGDSSFCETCRGFPL